MCLKLYEIRDDDVIIFYLDFLVVNDLNFLITNTYNLSEQCLDAKLVRTNDVAQPYFLLVITKPRGQKLR